MYAVPGGLARALDSPTRAIDGHESTEPPKNSAGRREAGGVRQQLADRHRSDRRVAEVGTDGGRQPLADGLVQSELARLDELQDDDRRDHLGDAGDAEAVTELDRLRRLGGRERQWSSVIGGGVSPVTGTRRRRFGWRRGRHAVAERPAVHDLAVDGDGDRCGVVAGAEQP